MSKNDNILVPPLLPSHNAQHMSEVQEACGYLVRAGNWHEAGEAGMTQGDCCDGKHYHVEDDMGNIYCSYWKLHFDENYDNNLCESCQDMGGPCQGEDEDE